MHHLTRIDHRHNFSPYSTVLYLNSSPAASTTLHFESLAFIPQLFLSVIALPLALAKKDLAATMLAQTFAFVAWNKVCTSQVRVSLTMRKRSVLTTKVLSLVYDLPPILPSQFLSSPQSRTWIHCSRAMDCRSGKSSSNLFGSETAVADIEFLPGCMAL